MKLRSKVAALMGAGVLVLGIAGTTFAAGPGDNGGDATGNGTKSNATVDGSLSDAGDSATMAQDAVMVCDGNDVGSVSGEFTLTKDLDAGSVIVVYLVPNNGSNADPAGNVSKNETDITLDSSNNASGSVIDWEIDVTSGFTVSTGGILGVFAVNDDGTTAISSSKTNSLNCSEASSSSESSSSSETSSTSSSTSFTGSESGETSVPSQPNTATIGDSSSGPSNGAWLLVAALGALVGSIVVLTPAKAKNRR